MKPKLVLEIKGCIRIHDMSWICDVRFMNCVDMVFASWFPCCENLINLKMKEECLILINSVGGYVKFYERWYTCVVCVGRICEWLMHFRMVDIMRTSLLMIRVLGLYRIETDLKMLRKKRLLFVFVL